MMRYERRKSLRIEVVVTVNYDLECLGKTKNICERGLCLQLNKPYPKGTYIKMMFTLPGLKEMMVIGNVAWLKETQPDRYEIGIEFWYIEEKNRKILKQYIDTHTKPSNKQMYVLSLFS